MIIDRANETPIMGHMPFPFSINPDQVDGWLSRHQEDAAH